MKFIFSPPEIIYFKNYFCEASSDNLEICNHGADIGADRGVSDLKYSLIY